MHTNFLARKHLIPHFSATCENIFFNKIRFVKISVVFLEIDIYLATLIIYEVHKIKIIEVYMNYNCISKLVSSRN